MSELIFVGLGLYDERGLSLRGLEEASKCDLIFIETYTSPMPGLNLGNLEKLVGRKVEMLHRQDLEEKAPERILAEAAKRRVALLVPGDPLLATTHVSLRIQAEKMRVKTRVFHAGSVATAVAGVTGLHSYKFGRSVTLPLNALENNIETPYDVLVQNAWLGSHTLVLLEYDEKSGRFLSIREAIDFFRLVEQNRRGRVFDHLTMVVGIARVGGDDMQVEAGLAPRIGGLDFGKPPHSLVVVGSLHFTEAEALKVLAGGLDEELRS